MIRPILSGCCATAGVAANAAATMAQTPRRAFRMDFPPVAMNVCRSWASHAGALFIVASSLGPQRAPSSRVSRGAPPHGGRLPRRSRGRRARELAQGLAERVGDGGGARLAVLDGCPDAHLHALEHQARPAIAAIIDAEAAPA